ncbi:hypothetical protein BKK80_35230 (plasmid) [Cupriavidus malaysiensis]|uniref:Uncharacterized protein n=2 Tax=Cupriavidus malaysiensis TaxID=367825 RepID=A0ABN4TW22_9BURK|nr:hypothetical protein BKK80_35230 [Cupriavidus malaysiensis]
MGRLLSWLLAAGTGLWIGWVMLAADESVRIERAAAACGTVAKALGSTVRMVSPAVGESLFALHDEWSQRCQESIWYGFYSENQEPGEASEKPAATVRARKSRVAPEDQL